ncbi:MAG: BolA/IbaG family iron-sulfur metabolism protein [Planctomycetes bacterium]|nr:BolA/IbaG family iron-sulfur metabolism protein [Planctomycetota bacterium]
MNQSTPEKIRRRLTEALHPTSLDIEDQSHLHAGHAGARESGGGHYVVTLASPAFEGKSRMQKHQMVYAALGEMMQREIHALSIRVE